jgi:hypothetical protein
MLFTLRASAWRGRDGGWMRELYPDRDVINRTIPNDKNYPADAVQCDRCGGWGCPLCGNRGWLPRDHSRGRRCYRDGCDNPLPPGQLSVYCSNECAYMDT